MNKNQIAREVANHLQNHVGKNLTGGSAKNDFNKARYIVALVARRLQDGDVVDDGFGQSVSAWCPNGCGKTVVVERPGTFICSVCG